jgi:alpha-galactosidase
MAQPAPQILALHGEAASLVLEVQPGAPPLWRHLGLKLDPAGLPPLRTTRGAASFAMDVDVPLATAPGLGWFGPEAVQVQRGGVALPLHFSDVACRQDADAITITMADSRAGVQLQQQFARVPGGGFRCTASVTNLGTEAFCLARLASLLAPLPPGCDRLVSWRGRHNAELVECVEPLPAQAWVRQGRRGISGHGGPSGLLVLGEGAGWHAGLVLAAQLCWSGDAALAVERDDEGGFVLHMAAVPQPGELVLAPGATHQAPDVLLAISANGRNGAMAQHHAAVRQLLRWPGGTMAPRPVHLNSWEACYFDGEEPRILALAEQAAALGVERFVLDDGWFQGRRHDRAGLGDWVADAARHPAGLKPLADRVVALGMQFGLWVEPEMVNSDSDLYRAHPDWVLHQPGLPRPTARHQLVLNMALPQVQSHMFGALDALLRSAPISYLKWDHNRDLAPAGGMAQVAGTHALLARLRTAHPMVEIEGCAGGGGRSDAGMLPFVHRFWTSDNLDAGERLAMQRSFLAFLPPEVMGAHVGASPVHATGRLQRLGWRAGVTVAGHFGVELDPARLSDAERAELAEWIAFHKAWRHLLHGGQTLLGDAGDGRLWQAQGDGREWLLAVAQARPPHDKRPQPVLLPFLADAGPVKLRLLPTAGASARHGPAAPGMLADLAGDGLVFQGSWLAHAGLPLPALLAESIAFLHLSC